MWEGQPVAHAWMPGARRIRAGTDGGPLKGGAARVVWLTLGTAPRQVSIQSAASRLLADQRPCHLIWDPATGEMAQLISALRAGCALGVPEGLDWYNPGGSPEVNNEGRICLQIGILAHATEPFTSGPMAGIGKVTAWLDSWGIARRWPAGKPGDRYEGPHVRDRVLWARGGHFAASQVPGCENTGPGAIDIERLTGSRLHQVHDAEIPSRLPVPA